METIKHFTTTELEAGLEHIRLSPNVAMAPHSEAKLEMIVCRPADGQRQVLKTGTLDKTLGLIGDNWSTRGSSRTEDGQAHPEMQLNLMNSRAIQLIAGSKDRWPLAGDQLYVDMDLSDDHLPPGTQLQIGEAIIEITAIPHNGCKKFTERFGIDAVKFVNSKVGKQLHLRGINAKVIQGGEISSGDLIYKK
ncbi:MAG: MOSC domain-containing protein [Bacteroidetes bacterium]|nr:MOSC domain-containing protein [Bacteroidota bacterium]